MAFEKIGGVKKYIKYAECEKGDVLVEGTFLKDFQGKYGVQYEFNGKDGITVLNSSGHLNYLMDFVNEGDKVKIVYDGTVEMTKGPMKGKMAHQFELYRDSSSDPEAETEEVDDAFELNDLM